MANITIIIDGKTYKPLNENEITIEKENDGTTTIRHRISRLCCEETDKMGKITETGGSWEDIEKEAAEYCIEFGQHDSRQHST